MSELFQVQFLGVDEGSDPKSVPAGTLLRAENCQMDKFRRLRKRDGTTKLAKTILGGSTITTADRLISRGKDVALVGDEFAYERSSDLASWQAIGRPPSLRLTRRGLVDSTRSALVCDIATSGNLLVTAFTAGPTASANLYVQVENVATGAKVLPALLVAATVGSGHVRVRISGTNAYIAFSQGTNVFVNILSLTTMASLGTGVLDNAAATNSPLDFAIVTPASGNLTLYVAWAISSTTDRLKVGNFLASSLAAVDAAVTLATTSVTPASVSLSAVNGSGGKITVAAGLLGAGTIQTASLNADLTTSASAFQTGHARYVSIQSMPAGSTSFLLCFVGSTTAGAVSRMTSFVIDSALAKSTATERVTWQAVAMSRPWLTNSRWYVAATIVPKSTSLVVNDPIPNASAVIIELETADSITSVEDSPGHHVGTAENLTGWVPSVEGFVPNSAAVSSTVYVPTAYRNREPLNFQAIPIGWNLCAITINDEDSHRVASLGAGGLVAAAAPYWTDGASTWPYGFTHAPMILSLTASGGGAMAAGDYSYVAVYEWRDWNGVLHRSIPSPPRVITGVTANQQVAVVVATTAISQHQGPPYGAANVSCANPVSIVLYRTVAGATGDHYRLTLEPDYQVRINDPNAGSVSVADTKADADIGGGSPARTLATQPRLYTDTGELADVPPPSLITVTSHRGRLAGIGPDLRTVWLTKDSTQDVTVAPGFNEALTLAFASDKTALSSLDEKLVVFGEDTIDVVHGDGPDAAGQNNSWQIQRVQSDVGCVNARSPVTCPLGIVFETARGLELLDRGLNITWIGRNVEDTLALFPVITSAVLVPEKEEIRFTCNATNGLTGIVLAYDYSAKAWFTRTYTDTDAETTSVAFVDAALIDGVYTLLTAGGRVHQETSANKLDDAVNYVEMDVIVAPVSPAGNLAWTRLKDVTILGTSVTNHDLKVSVARNYATSYEQDTTFLAGSLATVVGPLEKCRLTMKTQKCHAIQIRIQDITPTTPGTYPVSTGDGPILEALAFRVSKRSGVARTAAGQQG